MKNDFERAKEDAEFFQFMEKYRRTANYFIAQYEASPDQLHALHLCMGAAFLAGKAAQSNNSEKKP